MNVIFSTKMSKLPNCLNYVYSLTHLSSVYEKVIGESVYFYSDCTTALV